MLNKKVLNRKNGVELLEVCLTSSTGQIETTWVIKSERIVSYGDVEIPLKFATRDEAETFFVQEAARCAICYQGPSIKGNNDMDIIEQEMRFIEQEMRFREIKCTLPPEGLRVLRAAASNIKNKGKTGAVLMCRLYLPALSPEDAELFLQWLAKKPA